MSALIAELISIGLRVFRDIKAQRDLDEVKLEAREKLMVAIDSTAAKEKLRRRKQ